ncbi:CPBP family intramembrane glutamic endopeptidase [Frankia nepalensis]|nr:type II CAAX endopeptidase family protein [Frankia nepalensis]
MSSRATVGPGPGPATGPPPGAGSPDDGPDPAEAADPASVMAPVGGGAGAAGSGDGGQGRAASGRVGEEPLSRGQLAAEVWLLLGVSLGMSGIFALIRYIGAVTRGPVRGQVAQLNGSYAPGRPWLDLALQLAGLLSDVLPAALAVYLLSRHGGGLAAIGLDGRRRGRDVAFGAAIAAAVGGAGLGLYLVAWHSGANLTVAPSGLPDVWWRIPVLLASALENAVTEEVIVAGYLLVRLRQLGWGDRRALAASALLRGSYHLYQGLGGFFGNVAMGLLFGWLFQRRGRVGPLIVAHTLIDAVAFVGYVLLVGRVSWLPTPG